MDLDLSVRFAIYRHFVATGGAPAVDDIAAVMDRPRTAILEAYIRLASKRMLVLMPDGESIRMALPFAALPTQHQVTALGRTYFANCAWDAFGIPAALHAHGDVRSRCEQTHEPLVLHLGEDGPAPSDWVFHSAVPAAHWWRDIVYT